ncbi:MAG: DUF87 domain-containing protein [Lachnospiraceae bacterium]|nr:DUF87 domain-containing protein [Kiritimatiellia bacterium]MBP5461460.1 DUF87 domain-containing protein [Lachnospiraceae bacterium]
MSRYEGYSEEQLQEHLANYLVDSWSYSSVSQFARNEKSFEKQYIYCEKDKSSASAVAGSAYHAALELFFRSMMNGLPEPDVIALQRDAYDYIDSFPGNSWKLQKTTPTVSDAKAASYASVNKLIDNFLKEKDVYLADVSEVLFVEEKWEEWLTVNGVEIPLPCHLRIDVGFLLKNGKRVICDHKSVTAFTDEAEVGLTRGKQAITYVIADKKHSGFDTDEVWFVENKISQNKDGSPQLRKNVLTMDDDSKRLYEAMLYEPLRRMLQAVSDPDYIYTVNDSDNMCDKGDLYSFWTRTMIAEIDDFPNVPAERRDRIAKRIKKVRDSSLAMISPKVITSFRKKAASFIQYDYSNSNMSNSEKIEHVLRTFGKAVQVYKEIEGFSSTTYLLQVSSGVKIGDVQKYSMDIANALDVPAVRVSNILEVYEGRSYLSIESNHQRTKNLDWDAKYLKDMKIPLGVDNYGRTVVWDLANSATPHMLDCGGTGSGKSVLIKSTIAYAELLKIRIIVFDPKNEFGYLSGKHEVVSDIEEIEVRMRELVKEMQELKGAFGGYTLIVFDEFADAYASAKSGKELDIKEEKVVGYYADGTPKTKIEVVGRHKTLEENLKMILQKGRSLGYRVLAATQRASVKVISGDAKVNMPVVVCFRVQKDTDSRVILGENGAETLTGKGDGLIKSPEYLDHTVRFQGFYKP